MNQCSRHETKPEPDWNVQWRGSSRVLLELQSFAFRSACLMPDFCSWVPTGSQIGRAEKQVPLLPTSKSFLISATATGQNMGSRMKPPEYRRNKLSQLRMNRSAFAKWDEGSRRGRAAMEIKPVLDPRMRIFWPSHWEAAMQS